MGWPEIYVLDGGLAGRPLVHGAGPAPIPELAEATTSRRSPPAELKALLDRGEAVVVDLAPSLAYEAGHIPGAWFAVRARLGDSLGKVPKAAMLVLTSPDGVLARLAAAELAIAGFAEIRVLDGGTAAWQRRRPAADRRPRGDGRHARTIAGAGPTTPMPAKGARQRYLDWEIELVAPDRTRGRCRLPHPGLKRTREVSRRDLAQVCHATVIFGV